MILNVDTMALQLASRCLSRSIRGCPGQIFIVPSKSSAFPLKTAVSSGPLNSFVLCRTLSFYPHGILRNFNLNNKVHPGATSKRFRRDDDYFRPFDIDTNVQKDTLIYTFKNDRHYFYLGLFGVVMIVFWSQLAYQAYLSFYGKDNASEKKVPSSTMGAIESKLKRIIPLMFLAFGILAFTYSVVSPQRTITKLTLMKGGHHLRVETYLFMHFRRHFEVPLEMVSCSRARDVKQSSHNLMNLKIKGRKLYFQVDKKDGKFLEPTLFDFAVALKRF